MPRRRPSKAGHPWLPAWFSMAGMKLLCTGKHFLYMQGIMAAEQRVHPASSLPGSDVNSSTQHMKMTAQLGTPPFNALPPTAGHYLQITASDDDRHGSQDRPDCTCG